MNEHYFDWQVYCILEQGKRELDKLLDNTKDAILNKQMSVSFTLAEWAAKMYEAEYQKRSDNLTATLLYSLYKITIKSDDNPLDKAFWRVNLSK